MHRPPNVTAQEEEVHRIIIDFIMMGFDFAYFGALATQLLRVFYFVHQIYFKVDF